MPKKLFNLYQSYNSQLIRINDCKMKSEIIFKTPIEGHYFFGYFDKSPIDKKSKRLLAHRVSFIDRLPNKNDFTEIGFFDIEEAGDFNVLDKTNAFNWQQGSMLQWLGPDHNNSIIFNTRMSDKFCSKVIDIKNNSTRILEQPIYSVTHDGCFAFSIDFERHYWCRRGYSYAGIENQSKNRNIVNDDGIDLVNISTGDTKRIIRIEELIEIQPISTMKDAIHYVEHVIPNKSGKKIAFLHRWLHDSGIHTRLICSTSDGEEVEVINDSGRVTHFSWMDDERLILYGAIENKFNSARKNKILNKLIIKNILPIYKMIFSGNSMIGNSPFTKRVSGDAYIHYDLEKRKAKKISNEKLDRDGHPSSPIGISEFFITDTYPDENSIAKLMIHDLVTDQTHIIDTLHSIKEFDNTPLRCDLHPKCSYDGKYISIDTMHSGVRSIYVYSYVF